MKALLTHPGTQYSHRLACQLHKCGLLSKFVTGLAYANDDITLRMLPRSVRNKIANRVLDCGIPADTILRIALPELVSLWKLSRGISSVDVMYHRNRSFQERVSSNLLNSSDAIIGFDTSSWILAERSIAHAKPFVLDQSIAHPLEKKSIYSSVLTQYPEWGEDIPDKDQFFLELEEREHSLSRVIVVASTFTRESLIKHGVSAAKIVLNPYGVGQEFFHASIQKPDTKFRFLYLGTLGARKGLPLLIDAWMDSRLYETSEMYLAGPATKFAIEAVNKTPGFTYKGRLSYREMPNLLAQCRCLVFPSFFEGFGQVILEAMASGMPVITTTATAGPDIIENNYDGFVVPPGNRTMLQQHMVGLSKDYSLCKEMGARAALKAKAFSWDAYGDRWRDIIKSLA